MLKEAERKSLVMIDVAAERAVLAGLFNIGHDALVDVADLLTPDCFQHGNNNSYYRVLSTALQDPNSKIDIPTFLSTAKSLKLDHLFSSQEEQKFIRALTLTPVEKSNLRKSAAKLLKLQKKDIFKNKLKQAIEKLDSFTGEESITKILAVGEEVVFDFAAEMGDSGEGVNHISKNLEEYVQNLIEHPNPIPGISSGLPEFDRAIGGGFRRASVNVVGARAKVGKTMFGDNVALHVAGKLGIPVLNLDTEMSSEEHWNRMIANLADVPIDEITTGKFAEDPKKKDAVLKAVAKLKAMPYHYASIAGQPPEETLGMMRRWIYKHVGFEEDGKRAKSCLIIYDYIKLMDDSSLGKGLAEFQALGFLMTNLHNFTVKYSLPILAFIQLNRDGINREDTDVASGSDRIIWLCSNFTIYKHKSEDEIANEGEHDGIEYNLKLVPIISRHGPGLAKGDYINVLGAYKYGRIKEGPLRSEVAPETPKQKPKTGRKKKSDSGESSDSGANELVF